MINAGTILKLKKQLLPTGRAFKVPVGGNFEKLLTGLGDEEALAFNTATGILDIIIPDNDNFTLEDAAYWEKVLSISSSTYDTIENRKAAITRKLQFPVGAKGRQHKLYLEGQLRSANFNVKVYEYSDIKDQFFGTVHDPNLPHYFEVHHGGIIIPNYTGIVANRLNEDDEIDVPSTIENLKNIFWIAGETFDQFITIPPYRVEEFRHIILTIKPLHTVAFLRVINADNWILATGNWNMNGYWYNSSLWT